MQSDPGYAERLKNLPDLEYRWLAEGDWSAGGGLAFPELARKQAYLVAPFDIPAHWFVWAGFDWGYNHPWRMGLYAQDEDGVVYGVDTTGGRHQQPPAIADRFWTMVDRAKIERSRVRRIVAGHDLWADVKARSENIPTLADQFRKLDTPLVQANISRIAGVQNLRRYFAGDPPRFRLFDTPGNRRKLDVLASRIADPDEIEDVRKVDADEHGEGGDDDYDECLVGWTSVQTDDGWQSLASMVGTVGKCLTPIGWRRYDSVRMTRRSAPTIRVRDEHGRTINATPNHPILTIRGWVDSVASTSATSGLSLLRPFVINETEQEFQGRTYWPTKGGYYRRRMRWLSREVWEANFGPIPPRHHVHHRDENPANNQPENFDLKSPKAHTRHHWTPERQHKAEVHMAKIRPLTKVWHRSPEGRAWHSENGKLNRAKRKPIPKQCAQCGNAFMGVQPFGRFCHPNCKMRARTRRLAGLPESSKSPKGRRKPSTI